MNSLSYLSRQFDVIASPLAPSAPPSTPTGEEFPDGSRGGDGRGGFFRPGLKRVQTWSARSFFIPSPAQTQEHQLQQQQRVLVGDSPPRRPRKRSGSTPYSLRYPLSSPGPSSSSSSLMVPHPVMSATADLKGASTSLSTFPGPLSSPSPPKAKPLPSEMSWVRRIYIVRLLYLLMQWCRSLWESALGSIGHATGPQHVHQEPDVETSADEKDSDDDTSMSGAPQVDKAHSRRSNLLQSTSSFFSFGLRQPKHTLASPFSQPSLPPTVHLIPPPEEGDSNTQQTIDNVRIIASSLSSGSTLTQQETGSSGAASAAGPSAPTKPALPFPKTLVLDLDETLIHSTTRPLFASSGGDRFFGLGRFFGRREKAGHMVEVVMGGRSTLYHVYKRPFVDYFLRKVSGWYTLVIFTASVQEYADPVIDWLDAGRGILARRLFRESCTQLDNGAYSKDLAVIEKDLARICLIDNSPISYSINQANGIPIEGWTQDPNDEALLDLLPVLDSLRFTNDVRRVLGLRGF